MILALGWDRPNVRYVVYCTHCQTEYFGDPEEVYHPKYEEIGKGLTSLSRAICSNPKFLDLIKTCEHAGQRFSAPEAVQLMEKL